MKPYLFRNITRQRLLRTRLRNTVSKMAFSAEELEFDEICLVEYSRTNNDATSDATELKQPRWIFCNHCQQEVSKSTFYRHQNQLLVEERPEEESVTLTDEESVNALMEDPTLMEDDCYCLESWNDEVGEVTGGGVTQTETDGVTDEVSDVMSWSVAEVFFKKFILRMRDNNNDNDNALQYNNW